MMDDSLEQCSSLQDDEVAVLESIYPDLIHLHPNPTCKPGRMYDLSLPIVLPHAMPTVIHTALSASSLCGEVFNASASTSTLPALEISHLPPLSCRLFFLPSYPIKEPPKVSIRALLPNGTRTSWLSSKIIRAAEAKLGSLWTEEAEQAGEGSGVVWRWWDWVGTGEFLTDFGLVVDGCLRLPAPPSLPPSSLHTALKSHNAQQVHGEFESTAFSCSICLENRKGKSCVQMPSCGCVFCNPCLSSCWSLAIQEGTLENVACPSVNCVKARATREAVKDGGTGEAVTAELVQSVVGEDLTARWQDLKEKRIAEIDPTYTICPQPFCQAPVPPPALPPTLPASASPTESPTIARTIRLTTLPSSSAARKPSSPAPSSSNYSAEDPWTRLRTCPKCHFSFCLYCSATWHGPHTPCAFPQTSALVLEYLSYDEGSAERRQMEQRRGKQNMERMVAKYREDEENKRWIESQTRACAGCGVRVEKSHGCNHMTCGRCNAHFCYRCGASISPQDPYAHYRRPGTACFERLFDQEEIDRFERETAGGAGFGWAEDHDPYGDLQPRGVWEW